MTIMSVRESRQNSEKAAQLRAWLLSYMDEDAVDGEGLPPGPRWVDKSQLLFKVPWRHGSSRKWVRSKDNFLYEAWAKHTGTHKVSSEIRAKKWKANFRCALNSLKDIKQDKSQGVRRGENAHRVYRFESVSKVREAYRSLPLLKKGSQCHLPQASLLPSIRQLLNESSHEELEEPELLDLESPRATSRGATDDLNITDSCRSGLQSEPREEFWVDSGTDVAMDTSNDNQTVDPLLLLFPDIESFQSRSEPEPYQQIVQEAEDSSDDLSSLLVTSDWDSDSTDLSQLLCSIELSQLSFSEMTPTLLFDLERNKQPL